MTLHANMKAENVVVMSGVDIYHHQHQILSEGNFSIYNIIVTILIAKNSALAAGEGDEI